MARSQWWRILEHQHSLAVIFNFFDTYTKIIRGVLAACLFASFLNVIFKQSHPNFADGISFHWVVRLFGCNRLRPNPTTSRQWSIGSLYDELKLFEHYENHNFRFNQLALHQGLSLFKKTIELYGCSVIILGAKVNECIKAFMDLPDKSRGAEIIFNTGPLCDHTSRDCLVTEILKTTNALLTRTCKAVSQYNSISQIYGVLWLDQMSDVEEVTSHNKWRKKGIEIGYKQMDRYGK